MQNVSETATGQSLYTTVRVEGRGLGELNPVKFSTPMRFTSSAPQGVDYALLGPVPVSGHK